MPSREDRRRRKERERQERRRGSTHPRPSADPTPVQQPDSVAAVTPPAPVLPPPLDLADRLDIKAKEFQAAGYTISRQSDTAVDLISEDVFSLRQLFRHLVLFYPPTYGVVPSDAVSLLIDEDRVLVWKHSGKPDRWIIGPVGVFFGLYCVLALISMITASPGSECSYVLVHAAMLAVGGYGLWIFAGAGVRAGSGATPISVALPEPLPSRRRALDRTPEERLLVFLEEEGQAGYVVTAYDRKSAELYRPEWWPSRGPLADILEATWTFWR